MDICVYCFLAVVSLAYLAGSFPTALVTGRLFFGRDIRREGSGNSGATNAFRQFGPLAGIVVLLVDCGKGVLVVLAAPAVYILLSGQEFPDALLLSVIAGLIAVIGHMWTIFARFRGGKGVATSAGMLAALAPVSFLLSLPVFVLVLGITGFVSLSSVTVALAFPLVVLVRHLLFQSYPVWFVLYSWALGALVVFAHRKNIGRLVKGEESRFERVRWLWHLFRRVYPER